MTDLAQAFLEYCQHALGLCENTIRGYGFDLRQYLEWLKRRNLTVESATLVDLDDYLIFLSKNGDKRSSVNRKLYCLKSFYRWLHRRGLVKDNMTIHFRNLKQGKRIPHFLSLDQQKALLDAAKRQNGKPTWMKERDSLLILFFLNTGLRVEEVCRVKLQDLDLKEQTLRVIGKGDKERIGVISDRLKVAIERYLKKIEKLKLGSLQEFAGFAARGLSIEDVADKVGISANAIRLSMRRKEEYSRRPRTFKKIRSFWKKEASKMPQKWLFFNRCGRPMITRHIFRIVKSLGHKIGIEDLHPHILRHTFATNLRRRGADLLLIKDACGHASVNTTQIYANIEDREYRKALRKYLQ